MGLIKNLIHNPTAKKYSSDNLYYGYIGTNQPYTETLAGQTIESYQYIGDKNSQFVIMQKLNKHERNNYLKSKYNTFIDSSKPQTQLYLALKNSSIQYYRVPSMQNIIIPCISTTQEANLVGECKLTLDVCDLGFEITIDDKYLTLPQICEYENKLNANQSKTFYHSTHRNPDYDFREYYEW